ncbi:hypothetical protein M5X11_05605 [Paenibacillus alginolyticus]|uniref:hypothetical protein n=1 Tax=Paenibacillus alginolyticus TaxID=59839 RepID=UPI00042926D5|nr:hypothetical protein [Paenibacillus alginolyticus]MCY9664434.1 hypothetical protein [Paenibacillus alginolyticus]
MEKESNTVIHSEERNAMNGDEAAKSSHLDGQEGTQDDSESGPMERTKEVMENIGIMINSI